MRFDGEQVFWNGAGLLAIVVVAIIAIQILRYGFLAARDLWSAWKRR